MTARRDAAQHHGTRAWPARVSMLALGLFVLSSVAQPANAQETVTTRAGVHPDYGRMVFDWPSPVEFTASAAGTTLTIGFERAMTTDLGALARTLDDYVTQASLSADGQTVTAVLTGPMAVSSFRNDRSIVVDLRSDANAQPAQAPEPAAPEPPAADQSTAASAPSAGPVDGAPTVPIRIGEHPDYTRVVFDWSESVPYRVLSAGGQMAVVFDAPANFDVAALSGRLPDRVTAPTLSRPEGSTALVMNIPPEVGLRHFPLDTKVVVDVLRGPAANSQAPGDAVLVEAAPDAALPPLGRPEPEQVAEAAPEPEPEPVSEAPQAPDASEQQEVETAEETVEEVEPAPSAEELQRQAEEELRLAEEQQRQAEDEAARAAAASGELEFARPEQDDAEAGPPLVSFTFEWPEEVGAVVFRRAEFVWVVFDQRTTLDLAPLRAQGKPFIDRIEQLPIGGATVIRMRVPDRTVNPIVQRSGFDWIVDFRRMRLKPREQIEIVADADPDIGPHLIFMTNNPGRLMVVPDPSVGDDLRLAAFKGNGVGMDGLRRYPEFELLPSAQGIAVVSQADDVLVDRHFQGFSISGPEGLHISAVSPEAPVSTGVTLSSRRLFDFETWLRGDDTEFNKVRENLLLAVGEVPNDRKNEARLDVARFLLAHDFGPEALGVLQVVEGEDEELMGRNEVRALRGAANVLTGRAEDAKEDWNDPRLDGFAESSLWRGATLAASGNYKEANERFKAGDSVLSRYPFPLKGRLALLRVETALANRDVRAANAWLRQLEGDMDKLRRGEQAALNFYRGRVAAARTDFDLAIELWEELVDGNDRYNAARAEQNLINLEYKQEQIDIEQALERLEKLRYQWRGDRFELMVLRRLGELYLEMGDYFSGLQNYRMAVTFFPNDPIAEQLAQKMTDIFRALYLEDEADRLPPLKALALYEEFRELTPAGPDGDELVEKLGDRLVAVDLLERAAAQFSYLIRERLQGEDRARLGAKLALVQLLDEKPLESIRTITQTGVLDLPGQLQDDRRRILARAYFEIDDPAESIKLLAGDVSREADLLRREIYWKTAEWSEAARVLQRLTGVPPDDPAEGMPDENARYAIAWAAALHLDKDARGLEHLRGAYGAAMVNSSFADVFRFIVDPATAGATGGDFTSVLDQVTGTEQFDAFLENYRDKLIGGDESPFS